MVSENELITRSDLVRVLYVRAWEIQLAPYAGRYMLGRSREIVFAAINGEE